MIPIAALRDSMQGSAPLPPVVPTPIQPAAEPVQRVPQPPNPYSSLAPLTGLGADPSRSISYAPFGNARADRMFGANSDAWMGGGSNPSWAAGYHLHLPTSAMAGDQVWSDTWPVPYVGPLSIDNSGTSGPMETPEIRWLYRELYRREPSVRAAVKGKSDAVACLDVSVIPQDPRNEHDCMAAEFVKWTVENTLLGWDGLVSQIVTPALIDGFSILEKTAITVSPERSRQWGGLWGLLHCRMLDTAWLRLQLDQYRNVLAVVNLVRGLQYYHIDKFLLFSYASLWNNPFGQSDLRACIRSCALIEDAYKLWYLALKMFGMPYLHGKTSQPHLKEQMAAALEDLRAGGYAVTPAEDEITLLNLASASSFSAFEANIRAMREDNFMAIRGAYLPFLEGVGGPDAHGNTAISKVASDTNTDLLAKSVARVLTHQLVPWLVRDNFPQGTGYPTITIGGTSWDEVGQSLEVGLTVARDLGLQLSKEQVYKRSNWAPPDGKDDVIDLLQFEVKKQEAMGQVQMQLQMQQMQAQQAMMPQQPPGGGAPGGEPPPSGGGGQPPAAPPQGGGGGQQDGDFEMGPVQQFSEGANDTRKFLSSWLDKSGNFHDLEGHNHGRWAAAKGLVGLGDMTGMFKKGWVRVYYHGNELFAHNDESHPNERQKAALADLALQNHLESVTHEHGDNSRTLWSKSDQFSDHAAPALMPSRFSEFANALLAELGPVRTFADKLDFDTPTDTGDAHPERKRLEKAIDADPDDHESHAKLADWLGQRGIHDEAAFHRSMAFRPNPDDVPEANAINDASPHVPTATPADDVTIPELKDRSPTHNEQVAIDGQPVYVGSTNVGSTWWNWKAKRLFVRFLDGSLYAYENVPLDVARGMIETDSPGRYVWNVLRADGYDYRRLEKGANKNRKPQVIRKHFSDGFGGELTGDHTQLVHTPDDSAVSTKYAQWLAAQGKGAHAEVVSKHGGGVERWAYWPDELEGHQPGRFYACPRSVSGASHVSLYQLADTRHADAPDVQHVLQWTMPVEPGGEWDVLNRLRKEGALRPPKMAAEPKTFAEKPAVAKPLGVPKITPSVKPEPTDSPRAKVGARADRQHREGVSPSGIFGRIGRNVKHAVRWAADTKGLSIFGTPAEKRAVAMRRAARSRATAEANPTPDSAPELPEADAIETPETEPVVRPVARRVATPVQKPYQVVADREPDTYPVEGEPVVQPRSPYAPSEQPQTVYPQPANDLALPGGAEPQPQPEPEAGQPAQAINDLSLPGGREPAKEPHPHDRIVESKRGYIKSQAAALAQHGVMPADAEKAIEYAMRQLLRDPQRGSLPLVFRTSDGRQVRTTLKYNPKPRGRTFSEWAVAEEAFSMEFAEPSSSEPSGAATDYVAHAHEQFNKAIDKNPLEAVNHHVYADFLDEQGHHDEAAFRRSMGEWMGTPMGQSSYKKGGLLRGSKWEIPHIRLDMSPRRQEEMRLDDAGVLWSTSSRKPFPAPTGASPQGVEGVIVSSGLHWKWRSPKSWHEGFMTGPDSDGKTSLSWPTYRHMEEGLRRAFMTNLERQRAAQGPQ